jgi:transglutaminase-like putative cysteine protease
VLTPHQELRVLSRSVVAVSAPDPAGRPDPAWEETRAALHYRKGEPARPEAQFAYASPYVAWDEEVAEYARVSFPPRRPLLEAARELTHRIHQDFRYDPAATTITTPVRRVLHERRGVCQDFTHLQIACLRALGLSARYVSGYLLTDPPPGGERLIGADASHAWLALYVPDRGYVDLDPTNDLLPADRHVTVAWGRDFGDVSPLRGVILGGAEHSLRVGVSVLPLEGDA